MIWNIHQWHSLSLITFVPQIASLPLNSLIHASTQKETEDTKWNLTGGYWLCITLGIAWKHVWSCCNTSGFPGATSLASSSHIWLSFTPPHPLPPSSPWNTYNIIICNMITPNNFLVQLVGCRSKTDKPKHEAILKPWVPWHHSTRQANPSLSHCIQTPRLQNPNQTRLQFSSTSVAPDVLLRRSYSILRLTDLLLEETDPLTTLFIKFQQWTWMRGKGLRLWWESLDWISGKNLYWRIGTGCPGKSLEMFKKCVDTPFQDFFFFFFQVWWCCIVSWTWWS